MKMNKSLWMGFGGVLLILGVLAYNWAAKSTTGSMERQDAALAAGAPSITPDASAPDAPSTAPIASVKASASPSRDAQAVPSSSPVAHSAHPSQPVSTVAGHPVEYPGQFARASVRVDGQDYQLTPNQVGNFPRILIQPKDLVHVQVAYPQGQTGDPVVVETEDGGNLDGKKTANIAALDGQQSVQFNFQATSQTGIYHVAVRNGPDVKVLSFWAGPEPEVRQ